MGECQRHDLILTLLKCCVIFKVKAVIDLGRAVSCIDESLIDVKSEIAFFARICQGFELFVP